MSRHDPIDTELIQRSLPEGHDCQFISSINSTQSAVQANSLLIADEQTAGVGRRGKQWLTPKDCAICLSYRFELPLKVANLSGYQITIALAIVDTIHGFDAKAKVQLKWPNDLYHQGQKFAGILINLIPKTQTTEVIVGIGINWQLPDQQLESVNQAVCNIPIKPDAEQTVSRSHFIAALVEKIERNNQQFIHYGLSGFLDQWQQHDYLKGKDIVVTGEQLNTTGDYLGLNQQGELMIKTKHAIKTYSSGEVSVKAL